MTTEEFARGWYAGCRSLTQYLFEEFRARRRGAIPSMDTIRFDMLVEKHLEQVEPEEETSTPDNREAPPAEPIRQGKYTRCPGCKGILSKRYPPRCPNCLQRLEVSR